MDIFKNNWEKTQNHVTISQQEVKAMVSLAFPKESLLHYEIIDGGCSNLNVKIRTKYQEDSFLLRIYIRNPASVIIEEELSSHLAGLIPIQTMLFSGKYQDKTFSIMTYIEGITLREGLIKKLCPVEEIMKDVGRLLSKLQSFPFPRSGFFNSTLSIVEIITKETYTQFFETVMVSSNIHTFFDYSQRTKIERIFYKNSKFLPHSEDACLVHGDFDPANILIRPVNGQWEVSGILDWEFAFAGSPLHDIANMLRYAHRLPNDIYEESFLKGLRDGGYAFPKYWKKTTHLLNFLALLDSLNRCDLEKSLKQVFDISDLIQWIVEELSC